MTPLERAARDLGEIYDGYADPKDTPENWGRAIAGVKAVLLAIREPSEAMIKAGVNEMSYGIGITGAWPAMIDTAGEG